MNRLAKYIGAAVAMGAVAFGALTPAVAQPFPWWGYHHNYYHHHYYHPYYRGYYPYYYDPGAAIASGIIGGIAGTIAGAVVHGGSSHVARCERAYRSYNPRTDRYNGYDGRTHLCRL